MCIETEIETDEFQQRCFWYVLTIKNLEGLKHFV